jgi:hypothetical protein
MISAPPQRGMRRRIRRKDYRVLRRIDDLLRDVFKALSNDVLNRLTQRCETG